MPQDPRDHYSKQDRAWLYWFLAGCGMLVVLLLVLLGAVALGAFLFAAPGEPSTSSDTGWTVQIGPEHKVFVQKIESPDAKSWYALFADSAGFGDPSWHLYEYPHDTDVEGVKLKSGAKDAAALFWNYAEAGDHADNPNIRLVRGRYIVFTRGGLHHSLYDIQQKKTLVNEQSPYHAVVGSEEYTKITPDPTMERTSELVKEWKMKNLHDPILKIIGSKAANKQ